MNGWYTMNRRAMFLTILMAGSLLGMTTVYEVGPSANDDFSARRASQTFVATVDSISEIAFLCGKKIMSGHYLCQLFDSTGAVRLGIAQSESAGLYDHELVPASFNPKVHTRKGFSYRLVITHSQDSSVNFYRNRHNPYPAGQLRGHSDFDLAGRIEGVNAFPYGFWGMNSCLTVTSNEAPRDFRYPEKWRSCIGSMKAAGVKWDRTGHCAWQHFQFEDSDRNSFHHEWCDRLMTYYALDSINVFWLFTQSTRWATCTASDLRIPHGTFFGEWYDGFPKNLFEPVIDERGDINADNYFAQYVYKFVRRYGPGGEFWRSHQGIPYNPVRYYDLWNEPEWALGWDSSGVQVHHYWCTDSVTDAVYDSLIAADDSEYHKRSLIFVYARLCAVGDSAIRMAAAYNNAKDSVFTVVYVPYYGSTSFVTTQEWLSGLRANGVADFCDGVSFHSYADPNSIPAFHNRHKVNLDSIWTWLKIHGFGAKFLWCGEFSTGCFKAGPDSNTVSFPVQTAEQLATFATLAANDLPVGPVTHAFMWGFSHMYFPDIEWEGRLFCLSRDDFTYRPPGYGYQQMAEILGNSRFVQRLVVQGVPDAGRVYEFSDPRTTRRIYVGWKERGAGAITFDVPLRTNGGKIVAVALNGKTHARIKATDINGFLAINLDTVPTYVCELADSAIRRPDLVIDSIWLEPSKPVNGGLFTINALLRNADQVTPARGNISIDFYFNDILVGRERTGGPIMPGGVTAYTSRPARLKTVGRIMCKVVVNQEKEFVELDHGNNVGYLAVVIAP